MGRDAELSVIGALLVDGDNTSPYTFGALKTDDFQDGECKSAFRACYDLYVKGKRIDPISVLDEMGGDQYREFLLKCANVMPSTKGFERYCEIVSDNSKRLNALGKLYDLQGDLDTAQPINVCRETASGIVEALTGAQAKTFTMKDMVFDFFKRGNEKPQYIGTGIRAVDERTFLQKGDYVILGGRPSTGKTAFTLQTAMFMARTLNVVYFSLETGQSKIFDRIVANQIGFRMPDIKKRNLSEKQWTLFADESNRLSSLKLTVVEAAGMDVGKIRSKAIQLKADVIFLDYLGLIQSRGNGRYEQVTNISIDLHTMAQQCGILVMALSQLSRGSKGDMSDLRESGQLEQDADCIMMLRENDDGSRTLEVPKNKEGQTGHVWLNFDGERQRFTEMENE